MSTLIITVDEISSIGESYFSFKYRRKLIKEYPLELLCRKKLISNGKGDTYHISSSELNILQNHCIDFFPYDACKSYQEYRHLKRNDYIQLMKFTFYWYIANGKMTEFITDLIKVNNCDFSIKWDVTATPPQRPSYCKLHLDVTRDGTD